MDKYQEIINYWNEKSKRDYISTASLSEDLNILQELVDKMTPKRVVINTHIREIRRGKGIQKEEIKSMYCPYCDKRITKCYNSYSTISKGCPYCLQALDWNGDSK